MYVTLPCGSLARIRIQHRRVKKNNENINIQQKSLSPELEKNNRHSFLQLRRWRQQESPRTP